MSKQTDIREDAIIITKDQLWREGIRDEQRLAIGAALIVDGIFSRQHSQGVVIKGHSLGGSHPHLASYYSVEPLIDDV